MYTPQRVAHLLIVYIAFVAGTCAVCHTLLAITASNFLSTRLVAAVKGPPSYSRVDGWLKRQSIAHIKKQTAAAAVPASNNTNPGKLDSTPERNVAHALALAAAIDNAEHSLATESITPHAEAVDTRNLGARHMTRRVRMPTCYALPCSRFATPKHETAQLKPLVVSVANVETLGVAADPRKKVLQKSRRAAKATGTKIAGKSVPKPHKPALISKFADQARLKSERRIALRRYRETPAEISYRSFVGTFVPAT